MGWFGNASGNVISMSGYRGDTGFRTLSEVEAYWEGLRRGRVVPKRSDIDPRGIENALEYAFILEKIAPGLARLRIAGMHLSDLMGMEVRGMPVTSFIPPAGRAAFSETLDQVMTTPAVAKLHLVAEDGIGKPPLEGRMLLLPLESDFGDISRVLGCFETRGPIGRAPRRFNILRTETRALDGSGPAPRAAQPDRARDRGSKIDSDGFREAQAEFDHRRDTRPAQRPHYLRLVKSDDD
jgi:hypothetical protein